jgi:CRISPR-associated exonuclease Cas4
MPEAIAANADPIPLSALQHWSYCPRQCALIHLEQAFAENVHTLRGQAVHHMVDTPGFETRAGCRLVRALPLWCERLGLIGKADMVEFQPDGTPYPVEYKHGRLTRDAARQRHDDLQLAAQALCLEEMTGRAVPEGAIFQASSKRRRVVAITPELRAAVEQTAMAIRAMLLSGRMPPPLVNDARCKECSLIDLCQPQALNQLKQQTRDSLFNPDR